MADPEAVHERLLAIWHTGQESRGNKLGEVPTAPALGPWDTLEWRLFRQTDLGVGCICREHFFLPPSLQYNFELEKKELVSKYLICMSSKPRVFEECWSCI